MFKLKFLVVSIFFSNVLSASSRVETIKKILSPHTQETICHLVSTWEKCRPSLYDNKGRWTGKMACGITAAITSEFLKRKLDQKPTRIIVDNPKTNFDHSFLTLK